MRILRIACRDFMSFEELDLDLSEIDTAAVVGKNGGGKSTLAIDLVTFPLWGEGRAPTLAKYVREGADEAMSRIAFASGGDEYTVIRNIYASGRGNTVTFLKNGEDAMPPKEGVEQAAFENKAQHTAKEIQAEINRVIGLDYESVIAGPIMIQNDSANLMGLGPSKGKDLLIKLFGVERYDKWATEAKARSSAYARESVDLSGQVDLIDEAVKGEDQARFDVANARMELQLKKAELDAAVAEIATLRERQASLREQVRHADTLRMTVEQLSQRIASDKTEYDRQLRAISAAHVIKDEPEPTFPAIQDVTEDFISGLESTWRDLNEQASQRSAIAVQLPPLAKELTTLRERYAIIDTVPCHAKGKYAECRFLTGAPTEDEIEQVRSTGAALKAQLEGLATLDAAEAAYQLLDEARKKQSSYQREMLRRESAVAQWRLKVENALQTVKTGQASLERLLLQIERDQDRLVRATEQLGDTEVSGDTINEIEMEVRSLKDNHDEVAKSISMLYEPSVRHAEDALLRIEDAKAKRPDLDKRAREAQAKADTYALLAKAFHRDGIPTLIIENGIPLIEEHANDILGRMPDNYRVRLLTQREKKGGMMDRLSIVVEANGKERDYAMLSGGERFRIDFALRIALARVLTNRAGSSIETLIIDEGFGSQDDDGIEAMLESLAAVQDEFGLVLVVTHQKPVIERFQTRIEVSRDEGGSHAVLAS